jgi:hypothetical protein
MNRYLLAGIALMLAANATVALAVVIDLIQEHKRNRKARKKK